MRRFLLLPILAAAFAASAIPANAYILETGCAADDYRVVDLTVAGRELVEVCTDKNPIGQIGVACIPCIIK